MEDLKSKGSVALHCAGQFVTNKKKSSSEFLRAEDWDQVSAKNQTFVRNYYIIMTSYNIGYV